MMKNFHCLSFPLLRILWSLSALCQGQEAVTTSSVMNSTEVLTPFLRHGDSYQGRSPSTVIANSDSSVSVLLTVDNWSRWALVDPEMEVECGRLVLNEDRPDKGLIAIIKPGFSEMIMFEKKVGFSGVCGVVTYVLEVPPDEEAEYIQIMFSIPYNLQIHSAYFAIGVSEMFMNTSDLFSDLYYYAGAFQRGVAGKMVQFSSERILIRGTMTPDTYKPMLSVRIKPLKAEDKFTPGEYFSPRIKNSGAYKSTTNIALVLFVVSKALQMR